MNDKGKKDYSRLEERCEIDNWIESTLKMQTTLVDVSQQGVNPKTTLYVGGLDECVTKEILQAAFVPFGEVMDVNIPLDHATGQHRGFGFIQFDSAEDAEAAIDNMHNAGESCFHWL